MRELFESTVERLLADICTPEAVLASEGGQWPAALWAAVEDSGFALAPSFFIYSKESTMKAPVTGWSPSHPSG